MTDAEAKKRGRMKVNDGRNGRGCKNVQALCRLLPYIFLKSPTQQWPQDWKRSLFIPVPKKGNAKECSNYRTIAPISHSSKVMLKILQVRLQQYVNHELADVHLTECMKQSKENQNASLFLNL